MRPSERSLERLDGVEQHNGYHMAGHLIDPRQNPSLRVKEEEGDAPNGWTQTEPTKSVHMAKKELQRAPTQERPLPEIITAADLMREELPPVRWIVPDLLPEGVTLLAGKPKLGKSWLALGLTIAVSSGEAALGTKPVEQGACLYLALEDNRRRLQRRLSKLLTNGEAPNGLSIATQWPRLDDGGVQAIEDWIGMHPETRLIVMDTLKKIRPRTNGKRGVYDTDYEALEPLLPVAAEHRVAMLVVHHLRTMPADDLLDEVSGSTGLTGGVDGALVLKRDRGKADAYLYVLGRDIEEEAKLALRWDSGVASWSLVADANGQQRTEARQKILDLLVATDKPMGPKEIALALGKKDEKGCNATRQLLFQMSKRGEVKLADRGQYILPNTPNNHNESLNDGRSHVTTTLQAPNEKPAETPEDKTNVSDVRNVRTP